MKDDFVSISNDIFEFSILQDGLQQEDEVNIDLDR